MDHKFMLIVRVLLSVVLISTMTIIYVFHATNIKQTRVVHLPGRGINAVERHCLRFDIGGHVFNESGLADPVHGDVTTCFVHSFSPYIEREAAKRFLDPVRDNDYYGISPAITLLDDQLILVARIWLNRERKIGLDDSEWPANVFTDNWLYMQRYDTDMEPITEGSILGIPSHEFKYYSGLEDPRLIKMTDGRLVILCIAVIAFNKRSAFQTQLWIDVEKNLPIIPYIEEAGTHGRTTEKNWMGFVESDNFIYFVYTLDPLRILRCTIEGHCVFVQRDEQRASGSGSSFKFNDYFQHLRGGTSFELYRWPYYISFAHTTMFKASNGKRYITGHLIVMCVRPSYRIVYVSNVIKVHRRICQAASPIVTNWLEDGFFFPVGLIIENDDSLLIGGHVNDRSSIMVRMTGVKKIMTEIIRLDESRQPLSHGPPVGFIQTYIHSHLVNYTKIQFAHSP